MNVLLVGEDAAGMRTLQSLHQGNARIVAVMASPLRQNSLDGSLWSLAAKLGYTTWPADLVKNPNFATHVREHQVDIIVNVHSLFLIRKEILEAPRLGSYNLHPGPLPRYAGLNSVCWAIYRGEEEHGVTLHKMEPGIDAGPIVYQQMLEIEAEETGLSLTAKCVNAGIPLVLRLLKAAAQDPVEIPAISQDLTKREYFGQEAPNGGNLCWNGPARRISDFVRACDFFPFRSPWGHPCARLRGSEFRIVKVRLTGTPVEAPPGAVGEARAAGVEVACGDEWILVRQVFRGGKYLPARAVLRPGDQLEN